MGVSEDGRAEAEEGLKWKTRGVEHWGREELLLEVDFGEGVVEAAEGVAETTRTELAESGDGALARTAKLGRIEKVTTHVAM